MKLLIWILMKFAMSRARLRQLAGWTAIVTGPLWILAWIMAWPFMIFLPLWFLFWLSAAHWDFARNEQLTQTHVRMIDYLYLSAAAGSIFLAVPQYRDARDRYLRMLDELSVPSDKAGIVRLLDDESSYTCAPSLIEFAPDRYCDWIAGLRMFFDTTYTAFDLETRAKAGREVIDAEGWTSWWVTWRLFVSYGEDDGSRRMIMNPNSLTDRVRLTLHAELAAGRMADRITHGMDRIAEARFVNAGEVVLRPESVGFFPAVGGLWPSALWPILLAFALAIRLVKVTAEVSGWVK
jgi:hypothetical protein